MPYPPDARFGIALDQPNDTYDVERTINDPFRALFAAVPRRLAEVVVPAGGQAEIDFPAIPQGFRHLALTVYARGTAAAINAALRARFNGDAAAAYDFAEYAAAAGGVSAAEGIGQDHIRAGFLPAAQADAGLFNAVRIHVPDYRGAGQKTLNADSSYKTAGATGVVQKRGNAGFWRSGAAITRLTLSTGAGGFAAGSVATLVGEP